MAFPNTAKDGEAVAFTQANIVKFHANKSTYIQVSKTNTGAYALATDQATHAFGRLGQSKATGTTDGNPFMLGVPDSTNAKRAGFQISLFPEAVADS